MLISSEGIVFRTVKYGESSLILDIYSLEKGLQSYIVGSVRKKNAKITSGTLQPMQIVDFTAYIKDNDKLNRIKEIRLAQFYKTLPFKIDKMSIGLFMIEVCRKSIHERTENPKLYRFLKDWFAFVDDTSQSIANLHLLFLIELAVELGFGPSDTWKNDSSCFNLMEGMFVEFSDDSKYAVDAETSLYIHYLFHYDKNSIHQLSIPKQNRIQLLYKLIDYYNLHLEHFGTVKSLPILQEVLN